MPFSDVPSYLKALPEEFRTMVEGLRKIVKSSDKRIQERIKWNAPSFYHLEDIVTFGPIRKEKMVLVFHHPSVVKIKSPFLEGNYKDRRLFWFESMKDIKTAEKDLTKTLKFIVSEIDKKQGPANAKPIGSLKTCKQGHQFYKSSDCPVCPKCEALKKNTGFVGGLSAPARRALENKGIKTLKALAKFTEKEILLLHGIGPSAIPILRKALKAEDLKFK